MLVKLPHRTVSSELQTQFPQARVYCLDLDYNVVTPESVATFGDELLTMLMSMASMKWSPHWDCNRFGIFAWALAQVKHFQAARVGNTVGLGEAVAWGVICYNIEAVTGRGHARNLYRAADKWVAWEPQTRLDAPLTRAEEESAWLVLV